MSTAVKTEPRAAYIYSVDNLPESDGKPMAETPRHVLLIVESLEQLRQHFKYDPSIYIIGNVFVYFLDQEGTLRRCAPDIFAVRGSSQEERRVWAVEHEGKAPDLVIEFTSKKTKRIDTIKKKEDYAWLAVKEYFLFDPFGEYLRPRLQGFELVEGQYRAMPSLHGRLQSRVLGLDLVAEGERLRFFDALSGLPLRTYEEVEEARKAEEKARWQVERELATLKEELDRLQSGNDGNDRS